MRYKRIRSGDGKWVEAKANTDGQVQRQDWRREWLMDKIMGDSERILVEFACDVIDSRGPIYIIWIN